MDADLRVYGRRGDAEGLALVVARSLPGADVKGRGDSFRVSHTRSPSLLRLRPDVTVHIDRRPFVGAGAAAERGKVRDTIVRRMRGPGLQEVLGIVDHLAVVVSFVPGDRAIAFRAGDRMFAVALDVAARADGFLLDLTEGRVLSVTGQVLASTELLLAEGGAPIDPSPDRVKARLVVLVAVGARTLTEYDGRDVDEARRAISAWVRAAGVSGELEAEEQALLDCPPRALSDDQLAAGTWQIEGAAVLAWALDLLPDLPPYDQPVDPTLLTGTLHFPDPEATRRVLRSASRRHQAVVDDEAERHAAILWRLNDYLGGSGRLDLASVVTQGSATRFERVELLGGDLAIGGSPIYEAEAETVDVARSITAERLRALTWLRRGGRYSTTELPP